MQHYAGIDVSLECSSVCVVDATGKIVREGKAGSDPESLIAWFGALGFGLARIGLEAGAINVVDELVEYAASVRIGKEPSIAGLVTFWLHAADDRGPLEDLIASVTERRAAFLVVESVPLRNTTRVATLGQRTPGVNKVTCIEPKEGMAYEDFIRHWHTVHRAVALETQSTYAYVRNEIVRAFTPDAPPWAAIVEEGFPAEAMNDPMVFFAGNGSEETYRRNFQRMMDSCVAFLALDRIETHPMSEYVFAR